MSQLALFDPASWTAPLPIGPRVKRPWARPTHTIEVREHPTVADLLDRTWAPPAWPKGHACIYKATLIGTTRAYVGKAVDLRDRFRCHLKDDEYIGRALNAHGPENFTIEILWLAFSCADAYAHEDSFIEEHHARTKQGGFNVADGGKGFTSEEMRRWNKTPAGQAAQARASTLGCEARSRVAGYPGRRVLAMLKEGPASVDSMVASLNIGKIQVYVALTHLRRLGHHIVRDRAFGSLYRLVTLEQSVDAWPGGPEPKNADRVFWALTEGPRTEAELAALPGLKYSSVRASIQELRKGRDFFVLGCKIKCPGCVIESRGAIQRLGRHGKYHMVIDAHHPVWAHLGVMDFRGAHDDRE